MISSFISKVIVGLFMPMMMTRISVESALIGDYCKNDGDCLPKLSQCEGSKCVCKPYSIAANSTTCLPGSLLGFSCEVDAQCRIKVPTSGCVAKVCACSDGYVAYRRHTCLAPAKLGQICFENEQCGLSDRGSYCKFVVPKVFGRCQPTFAIARRLGEPCHEDKDCSMLNAYCQRKLDGQSVCTCDIAFTPSSDRRRCQPTYRSLLTPASLGYPCHAHLQCQLSDPNSICHKGICDCVASRHSLCSAKRTGCPPNTFQCESDGKCISSFFICDGKVDCLKDKSDEAMCNFETTECPPQAFQCDEHLFYGNVSDNFQNNNIEEPRRGVKCIARSRLCDGKKDCPHGSDEFGCKGRDKCPPGTFQCATTKECLPEFRFCNAIADCKDLSDEKEKCRVEFQPSDYCPFRCDNGLCRSSAIVCSGIDGCGDGSDEKNCQVCRCPRASPPSFKKNWTT